MPRRLTPGGRSLLAVLITMLAGLGLLAGPAAARHRAPRRAPVPASFVGMLSTTLSPYVGTPATWDAQFAAMAQAGVGTLRPTFDAARPAPQLDAFVLSAARHHVRVMPMLLDSTRYHAPVDPRHGFPAPSAASFASFAGAMAHRYGRNGTLWTGANAALRRGAIQSWQVWNEPNLPVYWRPTPDPRAYARLAQATSAAIRRYDRQATVVSAGIPDSTQSHPLSYSRYLAAFLKAGGGKAVDAIGVHAYAHDAKGFAKILATYRRILDQHGGRALKMWITEVGWADGGHKSAYMVGRAQARTIRDSFKLLGQMWQKDRIAGVMYFDWQDYTPAAGDPRGDTWGYHTGLLTRSGRPKPAFYAWRTAIQDLRRG